MSNLKSFEDLMGKLLTSEKYTENEAMGIYIYLLAGLTIATNAQLIFEIGTGHLFSTQAFLHGLEYTGGKIISCDIEKKWDSFSHPQFEFINKPSYEIAKTWNKKIDILFIDGDHRYQAVKNDYNLFSPFVKRGGLIIFHDANCPRVGQVREFVEEINSPKKIILDPYPGLAIIQKE